jgi:hypothetical protein
MSDISHLKFNFVRPNIGEANDTTQVENNLIAWMNHAFLEIGAWVNVTTGLVGYYSGSPSVLRPIKTPGYVPYTVYQAFRKDWVYEDPSCINYASGEPIVCSGIYVNNVFYPTATTTGAYAHRISFPQGAVTFINGGVSGVSVQAEYSYRLVQITKGDSADFYNFEKYSNREDSAAFLSFGSGNKDVGIDNRLQMPGIMIALGRKSTKPWQLGTAASWLYQSVNFHIFAEDKFWRDQLASILSWQEWKTIKMMDFNSVKNSGHYPLNIYGSINPSGKMYPDLIATSDQGGHFQQNLRFTDTYINNLQKVHKDLYIGTVSTVCEYLMIS